MKYTCSEYREEMLLLALQKQLQNKDLSEEERDALKEKIKKLEEEMGMS